MPNDAITPQDLLNDKIQTIQLTIQQRIDHLEGSLIAMSRRIDEATEAAAEAVGNLQVELRRAREYTARIEDRVIRLEER